MLPDFVLTMALFTPEFKFGSEPRSRIWLLAFATREVGIISMPWDYTQGYYQALRMTSIWAKVSIKDVREGTAALARYLQLITNLRIPHVVWILP